MRSALPLLVVLSLAACASPRPPTAEQYSQAFDETSAKAATGDVVAERELGGMYFSGQGVPQDYAESADWYGKAAEGGDAQAQAQLGFAYEYGGRGVPKDAARGQALLLQAASQGLPIAESVAGYNFLSGTGTSADYGQAHVWLEKAAKAGEPSAATNLGSMYCRGDGVQKDEAACVSWYKQAAQLGSRPGQLLLADAYRDGLYGLPKDQGIANKYFAEAAATPVETLQELHTAIYEILDSHKVYPKEAIAAHQQGTVKVTFVVPNRTVAAYTIDRSSGYPSLDQAARQALADCLFPPKAPSLQGVTKLTVDMTFNLGSKPLVPAATTSASPASSTH